MNRRSLFSLAVAIALTTTIGVESWITRDNRAAADVAASAYTLPTHGPAYVAIGDSFTAGGTIGALQPQSGDCLRSQHNYPSLVAQELGYKLTDASCFGATTSDVLDGSDNLPAQVSALSDKTKVVTVSVGGNDLGVFTTIFLTCVQASHPTSTGAPCKNLFGRKLATNGDRLIKRFDQVLGTVQKRAPQARIVVVNYLSLMPRNKTCSATPFAPQDVAWFAGVEKTMSQAVLTAATARGLDVVDMHDKSLSHNVCSGKDAWVNGAQPKPHGGILFHPNRAGEQAIANAVTAKLESRSS